jgi:hypothetical protein
VSRVDRRTVETRDHYRAKEQRPQVYGALDLDIGVRRDGNSER